MEMFELEFCSFGPVVNYLFGIGWDDGLAPKRRQTIILTNDDLLHWRISLGVIELKCLKSTKQYHSTSTPSVKEFTCLCLATSISSIQLLFYDDLFCIQ